METNYSLCRCISKEPVEWGLWSSWTSCTVTCGGGEKMKTRKCRLVSRLRRGVSTLRENCNMSQCHSGNYIIKIFMFGDDVNFICIYIS